MPRDRYEDEDDRPRRRRDEDDGLDDDRPRRSRREDDEFDRPPPKKGMSTGLVLGIVFGVVLLLAVPCVAVLVGLLLPAVQKVREAASRQQAMNNMKQVAVGLHNSADANFKLHGPFVDPPPGANLPPQDRLSWRAGLLPYIGHRDVYQQLKTDQPWNSPANSGPAGRVIPAYADPLDGPPSANTRVRLFYDNGALFDSEPAQRTTLAGITDGSSNTIAYVESADTIPWAQPNDYRFDPNGLLPTLGHPRRSTTMVAMADGSVRAVSKSVSQQTLKAAITRAGGEVVSLD